jgi:hypothetical protein
MKTVLFGLLLAVLGIGLYWWTFGRGAQVYARLPRLKVGMRPTQLRSVLGAPDTAYTWPEAPFPAVWEYDMGPLAPDAVRVFFRQDTVMGVTYNQ